MLTISKPSQQTSEPPGPRVPGGSVCHCSANQPNQRRTKPANQTTENGSRLHASKPANQQHREPLKNGPDTPYRFAALKIVNGRSVVNSRLLVNRCSVVNERSASNFRVSFSREKSPYKGHLFRKIFASPTIESDQFQVLLQQVIRCPVTHCGWFACGLPKSIKKPPC